MDDCLFCKIVAGEIPSTRIYEDDSTLAFLDIHPVKPGHMLVIPKEHAANIFEIKPEAWASVQETVRKVAIAMEQSLEIDGVNVNMNNREDAGQVIFHAHVHIIPRTKGDGLRLWAHSSYKEGEAESVAEKIKSAL